MNRPLHTPKKLVKLKTLLLSLVMMSGFLSTSLIGQPSFGTDECNCLDNATQTGDGQFFETFTVTSNTGESWSILSASNFFDPGTSTPGNPVAFNFPTPLNEVMPGRYEIDAIRVEGAPWSLIVSDGSIEVPLSSFHVCSYPDSTIYGDQGNCVGTADTYFVDINDSDLVSIQWSLPGGGGTFQTPSDSNNVEILWDNTVGTYPLSVTVTANPEGASPMADDCSFTSTIMVELLDEETVPMACNNEVIISLSPLCGMDLVPSTILEAMELTEASYDIILRDVEADTIVGINAIDYSYVGKKLEVTILHECSLNSCWGYILIEDKSAPPLLCGQPVDIDCDMLDDPSVTGFPLPPSAIITPLENDVYLIQNYDPCGDTYLRYQDEKTEGLCEGPYSAIITRTWYLTDEIGNTSSCSSIININRALFEDIIYPENWDDATGPNPSLEACGDWEKEPNGAPSPSVTGYPIGAQCVSATVEYQDALLPKCDESNGDRTFKVIRRWWLTDHCTGQDSIHLQYISVLDTTAPVVTVPEVIEINTTLHSCGAQVRVPAPEVDECSEYDYGISYRLKDNNGEPLGYPIVDGIWRDTDGTYIIEELPADQKEIWVIYAVYDVCGNVTEEVAEIAIVDNEEPIPVCDEFSYVALNQDGIAWAGPKTFDDGSWDNCGIALMEVRRIDSTACGIVSDWAEKVKFCCADIGDSIMVTLRITDHAGNSNACMVEVRVQDNYPPEWTFFPEDFEVDCDSILGDYTQFGMAEAEDNCDVEVTVENEPNLNSCGLGKIERIFTASDSAGNKTIRIQNIYIVNKDLFDEGHIDWPEDITLPNGCLNGGLEPEDLPVSHRYPILKETSCSQTDYNYEDLEFQYTQGACTKIIRKWTVIDWCQFDPFDPSKGKYFHNQVIKVLNSNPPEIIEGCEDVQNIEQLDGCNVIVTLIAQAQDDCTAPSDLLWRYELDIHSDSIVNKTGKDNDATTILPLGTHTITWYVKDECGNESKCVNKFTIADEKKPTPVCLDGIVTVIMDNSGTVTIWASDFDKGSYDNCTDNKDIIISFSSDTSDIWRTFTCADLDGETQDTFDLQIYITDAFGNNEFCNTTVIIQDNKNACGNDDDIIQEETIALAGAIYTDAHDMIKDVEVMLYTDTPEFPLSYLTNEDGKYAFQELSMYQDYSLKPEKSDAYLNGISTLDIVLIQRHILGIEELDSPYKLIAADVNNSKKVSASDIIQLRKLILGIYDQFPENESWRFVNENYDFSNVENPFPFEEVVLIEDASDNIYNDFVGVKIGDVNGSVSTSRFQSSTTRSISSISYQHRHDQVNNTLNYDFYIEDSREIAGFQVSFVNDIGDQRHIEIIGHNIKLESSHYFIDDRNISISYNGHLMRGYDNEPFFTISIDNYESSPEDMLLVSGAISPEIYYNQDGVIVTEKLSIHPKEELNEVIVSQNAPNPFKDYTNINFIIPEATKVTLRVFDLNGRKIMEKQAYYSKGQNEINIDASEMDAQGILYYQIETPHHSLTRKMIHIK